MITAAQHQFQTIWHNVPGSQFEPLYTRWRNKTKAPTETSLMHYINARAHLGYRAGLNDPNDYFNIAAFNNSTLGNIKAQLQGKPQQKLPERALVFGTCVHELLLEPEKIVNIDEYNLRPSELQHIQAMLQMARNRKLIQRCLKQGIFEETGIWTDEDTKLLCKVKKDIALGNKLLDIKTTSAKNKSDFQDSIKTYEYDRQAAFYLDSNPNYESFEFIAMQKVPPYDIWTHRILKGSPEYQKGRKKYKFLLTKALELGIKP